MQLNSFDVEVKDTRPEVKRIWIFQAVHKTASIAIKAENLREQRSELS